MARTGRSRHFLRTVTGAAAVATREAGEGISTHCAHCAGQPCTVAASALSTAPEDAPAAAVGGWRGRERRRLVDRLGLQSTGGAGAVRSWSRVVMTSSSVPSVVLRADVPEAADLRLPRGAELRRLRHRAESAATCCGAASELSG